LTREFIAFENPETDKAATLTNIQIDQNGNNACRKNRALERCLFTTRGRCKMDRMKTKYPPAQELSNTAMSAQPPLA